MRPGRVGRVGVVGAPVAKAAVVGAAVGPGRNPVAKAAVVGAAVTPGRVTRRQNCSRRGGRHPRTPPPLLAGLGPAAVRGWENVRRHRSTRYAGQISPER